MVETDVLKNTIHKQNKDLMRECCGSDLGRVIVYCTTVASNKYSQNKSLVKNVIVNQYSYITLSVLCVTEDYRWWPFLYSFSLYY